MLLAMLRQMNTSQGQRKKSKKKSQSQAALVDPGPEDNGAKKETQRHESSERLACPALLQKKQLNHP